MSQPLTKAADSFALYGDLPPEVRVMIWEEAFEALSYRFSLFLPADHLIKFAVHGFMRRPHEMDILGAVDADSHQVYLQQVSKRRTRGLAAFRPTFDMLYVDFLNLALMNHVDNSRSHRVLTEARFDSDQGVRWDKQMHDLGAPSAENLWISPRLLRFWNLPLINTIQDNFPSWRIMLTGDADMDDYQIVRPLMQEHHGSPLTTRISMTLMRTHELYYRRLCSVDFIKLGVEGSVVWDTFTRCRCKSTNCSGTMVRRPPLAQRLGKWNPMKKPFAGV